MEVDLIGTEAVCEYIRHSHMNYYWVHKYPSQSGALGVYEYTSGINSSQCATDFLEWANIMNKGGKNYHAYQITIANYKEDEDENAKADLKRKRKQKIRASFIFYAEDSKAPQSHLNGGLSYSNNNYQQGIDEKIQSLRSELTLKFENEKLQERIDDLEDELEEIGEAPQSPEWLSKLLPLITGEKATPKEATASLSGFTEDKRQSLNNSIKILLQYDTDLPQHLEKLSHLAQTNTAKFHVLINMIDTQL